MAPLRAGKGENLEVKRAVGTPPLSLRRGSGGAAKLRLAGGAGPRGGGVCAPDWAAAAAAALTASEGRRPRPGPSPEPPLPGAPWSLRAGSAWGRAQARPAAEPGIEAARPRTRPAQPW